MYRRPGGAYFAEFSTTFYPYFTKYSNIVIVGDLNCDFKSNKPEALQLNNFLNDFLLNVIPTGPTYQQNNSNRSWLDLIITTNNKLISSHSTSRFPFQLRHDLLHCSIKSNLSLKHEPKFILSRSWKNCNLTNFNKHLKDLMNAELTNLNDSNDACNTFYSCLHYILDYHVPVCKHILKSRRHPWFNSNIREKIKHKNNLYNKLKIFNNSKTKKKITGLRKQIKTEIQKSKAEFIYSKLNTTYRNNNTAFWSTFRMISGSYSNSKNSALNYFSAETLVSHYANIASAHEPVFESNLESILNEPSLTTSTFNFCKIHVVETSLQVSNAINSASGQSPDTLPLQYIKHSINILAPHINRLFNNIIEKSTYPDKWKLAYIVPILKINKPSTPSDTRPIAILSQLAKVFDKIITKQISQYIESTGLLSPFQSAYRCGFSTESALLFLTDSIRKELDNHKVVILIQFDISKAFDSIDHGLLLRRLRNFGFSRNACKLLWSYVTNREICIKNSNGNLSSKRKLSSGILQGSSLAAWLFLVYMYPLPSVIKHCQMGFFADDTYIWLSSTREQIDQALDLIEQDANDIHSMFVSSKLSSNVTKTKAIIFSPSPIHNVNLRNIIINNQPISYASDIKLLGIHMSSDLSWNKQVSQITKKVNFSLQRSYKFASFMPVKIKDSLVKSLICPIIDYSSTVYNDISQFLFNKIELLHNRSIRLIYRLPRTAHISQYKKKSSILTPSLLKIIT